MSRKKRRARHPKGEWSYNFAMTMLALLVRRQGGRVEVGEEEFQQTVKDQPGISWLAPHEDSSTGAIVVTDPKEGLH